MSIRITRIIDEFDDYRAYVSHTLCKHRLFLGLNSADGARLRLRDASVWPLVRDEANQLLKLHSSLFGLISPSFKEVQTKVSSVLEKADIHICRLKGGDDHAFEPFDQASRELSQLLSSIGQLLDEEIPDFSEEAVLSYLNNRCSDEILQEVYKYIRVTLLPLIRKLHNEDNESDNAYRGFWPVSSTAYLLTRTAIVATAVEDISKEDIITIRTLQRRLRGIERIVSCWSPNASKDSRPDEIQKALVADGFSSWDNFVADLKVLGNDAG